MEKMNNITVSTHINIPVFSPQQRLETSCALNAQGRIVSMGKPDLGPGPLFSLIRTRAHCAWAVHENVPATIAKEIAALAREEPPVREDFQAPPVHAQAYLDLLGGNACAGPAFIFPDTLPAIFGVTMIKDAVPLQKHLNGWDHIEGWTPIMAVVEEGHAVSACFSARRSSVAAEAGLNTSEKWRGRGFAAKVTTAWAQAIRDEGLLPVYSTNWTNHESLAVTRKLGLTMVASDWKVIRS
jgi:hypothetical protein